MAALSLAMLVGCSHKKDKSLDYIPPAGTGGDNGGDDGLDPDHLRNGIVGVYYSDKITPEMMGMPADASPVTWSIKSGTLPPGLVLNQLTGNMMVPWPTVVHLGDLGPGSGLPAEDGRQNKHHQRVF